VTSSTHASQGRFTHKNCVVLLTVLHTYSFVRSSRHYQAIVLGSTPSTNTISTKLTRRTCSQHQNAYIIPGTGTPNQTLYSINPTPLPLPPSCNWHNDSQLVLAIKDIEFASFPQEIRCCTKFLTHQPKLRLAYIVPCSAVTRTRERTRREKNSQHSTQIAYVRKITRRQRNARKGWNNTRRRQGHVLITSALKRANLEMPES
jgi:hypothetical protein